MSLPGDRQLIVKSHLQINTDALVWQLRMTLHNQLALCRKLHIVALKVLSYTVTPALWISVNICFDGHFFPYIFRMLGPNWIRTHDPGGTARPSPHTHTHRITLLKWLWYVPVRLEASAACDVMFPNSCRTVRLPVWERVMAAGASPSGPWDSRSGADGRAVSLETYGETQVCNLPRTTGGPE